MKIGQKSIHLNPSQSEIFNRNQNSIRFKPTYNPRLLIRIDPKEVLNPNESEARMI